MAGRHLKALLAAHRDRDDLAFRRAAQAIIEEERAKQHNVLATDLQRLLVSGGADRLAVSELPLPEPPKDRESAMPLADISAPERFLGDLVLAEPLLGVLRELVAEIRNWPALDAVGVPRRNRVLMYGPPGCGKSSIAGALAAELHRPLVTVRVDSVVSSYLGETASNLRRVMDFARSGPFVVLFDEFDSLGKDREDPSDHGELRRVVNAVLQLIDTYVGPSILIAATNHEQVLDDALWRRFDEVLNVPPPDEEQMVELVSRLLAGRRAADVDVLKTASLLAGLPHAAGEYAVFTALRAAVANGRRIVEQNDLAVGANRAIARRWG